MPGPVCETRSTDELDRALASAQERYEEKLRAEVDEKVRTQEAIAWFGHWANQVGMPTLTHLPSDCLRPATKPSSPPR